MQADGDVIKLYGAMNGNFTNASSGLFLSGRNGISIGGDLAGDINNAGSIIGGRYENFQRWWSNGKQYYVSYPSFKNVYVPEVISQNPPSGIHVNGNLNGNFINSGSIRAPQAVFINGDLIGDYSNTGIIEGGYVGLTTSANGGLSGNRSLTGNSVLIAGNFEGDFTTSVGQGILVGDYVHDWTPPTSYDLQAENLIIGCGKGGCPEFYAYIV